MKICRDCEQEFDEKGIWATRCREQLNTVMTVCPECADPTERLNPERDVKATPNHHMPVVVERPPLPKITQTWEPYKGVVRDILRPLEVQVGQLGYHTTMCLDYQTKKFELYCWWNHTKVAWYTLLYRDGVIKVILIDQGAAWPQNQSK